MKTMTKKIGAIILAMAMCFSLCCTALVSADEGDPEYKITIQNSANEKTYNVYKIFDATSSGEGVVAYTIDSASAWFSVISNGYTANVEGVQTQVDTPFEVTRQGDSTTYTVTWDNENTSEQDIIDFLVGAGIPSSSDYHGTGNGGSLEISVGGEGYYLITSELGTVVTITNATPEATVIDKNTTPGDLKKVMEKVDTGADVEAGADAIGEDIDFKITANVPLYSTGDSVNPDGYLVTDYEFDDEMDESLDIETISQKDKDSEEAGYYIGTDGKYYANDALINEWVTIGSATNAKTDVNLTDCAYNVVLELEPILEDGVAKTSETTGNVLFHGFTLTYDTWTTTDDGEIVVSSTYPTDATIEIDYTAHLNEAAEYDNTNEVTMSWHMTPYKTPDPENPIYSGKEEDHDDVYVMDLDIYKVDSEDNSPLAGAVFELYGENLVDVVVTTTVTYDPIESIEDYQAAIVAGDTLYFELITAVDGEKYTTVNPYELDPAEAAELYVNNGNQEILDPSDPDYNYIYTAYTQSVTSGTRLVPSGTTHTVTGTTGTDGKISFNGLTEGTYTLKEITAPDGYNLLQGTITIEVKYVSSPDADGHDNGYFTVEVTGLDGAQNVYDNNGTISLNIENSKGAELPSTGGIGTTIFYIIGGVLVVGAVVVLVTRRRVNREV